MLFPVLLSASVSMAAGQSASTLAPESSTQVKIAPGEKQSYALLTSAGQTTVLTIDQNVGTVTATVGTGAPQRNRSGKLSQITMHIAAEQSGTETLVIANPSSRTTAEITLNVAAAHATSDQDRDEASIEQQTSEAETLLLQHDTPKLKEAVADLEKAEAVAEKIGDRKALVRALTLHTYALAFPLNDAAAALPIGKRACAFADEVKNESAVEAGNALKTCGFLNAKLGNYDDADGYYAQALADFEATDDRYNQVVVRENRAKIERIQQKDDAALADLDVALPIATSSGDLRGELAVRVEQGALLYEMNELGPAYEANMDALTLAAKQQDNYLAALAWNTLGVIYTDLHDFDRAADAFEQADQLFAKDKNDYGHLQVLHGRGELHYAQGDWKAAAEQFSRGVAAAEEKSLPREYVFYAWGLAQTQTRLGHLQEAQALLDKALQMAEKNKIAEIEASLLNAQAEVALRSNDGPKAKDIWTKALAAAETNHDKAAHLEALGGLARYARSRGNLADATSYALQAIDEIEATRSGISLSQLRLNYLASKRAFYELAVDALMDSGQPAEAFRICEQGRARMLLDQMSEAGVRSSDDPLSKQLLGNRIALLTAQEHLALMLSGRARGAEMAAEKFKIRQLELEDHKLRAQVPGAQSLQQALPASSEQVRAALPDSKTMLAEYWIGAEHSYLWCVTQKSFTSYRLAGTKELGRKVNVYLGDVLAPMQPAAGTSAQERVVRLTTARANSERESRQMQQILFPHGALTAGLMRLIVVPDGPLHSIPFSALLSPGGAYLGRKYAVVSEPSAAAMLSLLERGSGPATGMRAAVFSDPILRRQTTTVTNSDVRGVTASLLPTSVSSTLPPLPFAKTEIASIRQALGPDQTDLFAGYAAARSTALSLDWSRYAVGHFATHTLLNAHSPEFSGLVLSAFAADGAAEDPVLSYADILNMKAPLPLVVLSSCTSGGGRMVDGEGLAGIGNAFFGAGARRVVGSLWPVDDEATSELMRYFYRTLQHTHSATLALRQAQDELAADARWSSPAYWAAFTLAGDWRRLD